jgi:hypothetical protein
MASPETAWSQWIWDGTIQQYYQYRINRYGQTEYRDQSNNLITPSSVQQVGQGGYQQGYMQPNYYQGTNVQPGSHQLGVDTTMGYQQGFQQQDNLQRTP